MRVTVLAVFATICAMATAQLANSGIPSILSGPGGSGGGGMGGMGGMGGGGGMGGMMSNPMMMMLLPMIMQDPSGMSFPLISMLQQNPSIMQNPMGVFLISSMLGVDVHKLAGPMALMGGQSNMMSFLPLMSQDPSMMNVMMSGMLGGGGAGGMGAGLGGGLGAMGGLGGGMGGMGGMMPMLAMANY